MGRIIAIDYGQKRVGLATTDELQIIATPLGTVRTMDLFPYLHDYLRNNPVERFVVGEPRQMNNRISGAAVFIEPFVKKLIREFPQIPVDRMDERFTSAIAARVIRESGLKKKDRQDKARIDSISATLILQSYMDQKR